jgi:hypothetical protein
MAELISTHRNCGDWRRKRRMVRRLGGFWRLLRSATARRGRKRRRSAAWVCRSFETECCVSTLGVTISRVSTGKTVSALGIIVMCLRAIC